MIINDFNTQLVLLYEKQVNSKVELDFPRNATIDLILKKYISNLPIDQQNYLNTRVDSFFTALKEKGSISQKIEKFHQSPQSFIFGMVINFQVPTLNEDFSISSFTGSILLKNHAYGFSIILDGDTDIPLKEKNSICKKFISSLEKINSSR